MKTFFSVHLRQRFEMIHNGPSNVLKFLRTSWSYYRADDEYPPPPPHTHFTRQERRGGNDLGFNYVQRWGTISIDGGAESLQSRRYSTSHVTDGLVTQAQVNKRLMWIHAWVQDPELFDTNKALVVLPNATDFIHTVHFIWNVLHFGNDGSNGKCKWFFRRPHFRPHDVISGETRPHALSEFTWSMSKFITVCAVHRGRAFESLWRHLFKLAGDVRSGRGMYIS